MGVVTQFPRLSTPRNHRVKIIVNGKVDWEGCSVGQEPLPIQLKFGVTPNMVGVGIDGDGLVPPGWVGRGFVPEGDGQDLTPPSIPAHLDKKTSAWFPNGQGDTRELV